MIRDIASEAEKGQFTPHQFHRIYLHCYENVSILFADIKGFTGLKHGWLKDYTTYPIQKGTIVYCKNVFLSLRSGNNWKYSRMPIILKFVSFVVSFDGLYKIPQYTLHWIIIIQTVNKSMLWLTFTHIAAWASQCSAQELVRVLNDLFAKFDKLAAVSVKLLTIFHFSLDVFPILKSTNQ